MSIICRQINLRGCSYLVREGELFHLPSYDENITKDDYRRRIEQRRICVEQIIHYEGPLSNPINRVSVNPIRKDDRQEIRIITRMHDSEDHE